MIKDRVSVLVTFYNQEQYVDKALESVLSQKTDFGVKIIVGDDSSSDGTCEKVKQWISRYPGRIELHVMDRNEGDRIPGFRASKNRINILKFVDTEYFIYLDGDDYFDYEYKLQRQVEILDLPENSGCTACGHNIKMLYGDGTSKPATDPSIKEGRITLARYWKDIYIHTDTMLFRSSVIPKFDLALLENNFNDNMITYSALQEGDVYYIPELWAVYVQTSGGIWTGEKNIISLIRNMIFYDLSRKINPKMKYQSICRFSYLWQDLYKVRHSIRSSELKAYADEANDKGLKNASRWLMYQELNSFQRASLACKTFFIRAALPFIWRLI